MSAFTVPLAGAALVVNAAGQPCPGCQRVATLLVWRRVGAAVVLRCLTCDLGAA